MTDEQILAVDIAADFLTDKQIPFILATDFTVKIATADDTDLLRLLETSVTRLAKLYHRPPRDILKSLYRLYK